MFQSPKYTDLQIERAMTINQSLQKSMLSPVLRKINNQGLPIGLHSCIGVIAVLVGKSEDFQAKYYCLKLSKYFSAFKIPGIVDNKKIEVTPFEGTPIWHMRYYPYLKRLISENVKNVLRVN